MDNGESASAAGQAACELLLGPGRRDRCEGTPVLLVRAGHSVPRRRAPVRVRRRPDGPGGHVVETDPRRRARDSQARRQACHRGRQLAREPASGTGVPRVDAYCPQRRVQHRPEPFRQRRADLVEARQGSGGASADVCERGHGADGGCLRRVGRRRRVRDLDGPLDGRRRALPRPPQGGVLRGSHDPALRLGNRHSRAAAHLRQLESHRLGGHLAWPLLGTRVRELCANGVSRPPGGAHRGVRSPAPSDRAGSRDA